MPIVFGRVGGVADVDRRPRIAPVVGRSGLRGGGRPHGEANSVMITARRRSSRMSAALIMATPPNTSTESFDALYRECARDIYAYVRTLLGDDASAEDVTALAFERAYRRRATFDGRRGSERGWLFGIARNAALDELRRRKRSAPMLGELPDDAARAPEEEADLADPPHDRPRRARRAGSARPRARRPEVPRRAVQRRARRRARHERIQCRNPSASGRQQAEGGLQCAIVTP